MIYQSVSRKSEASPIPLTRKAAYGAPQRTREVGGAGTACIRTFGCQMNVHDSDRMRRMIRDAGYAEVDAYEDADMVILNTCYVRENAVDRVRGHLGELVRLKREGRVKKVALTGCIGAAEESRELQDQYGIDLVLGTHNTYELAEFVGLPTMAETFTPELPGTEGETSAFITIMTGCNYQCSYCIVPSVRGRMICRPLENVVDEVERLVASGTSYVTLLGQTVDAWRDPSGDGKRFCDLLERVADVAPRVWFTTSHPSNMEDRTLRAIGEKPTIVTRLHLPVQSGSDRMLKIMHRGYKAERYRRKIEVFRENVPGGTLSTDIIVGHPGETERDHEETLKLVEDCGFDSAYVFKFSPRRGTEAAQMGEDVPPDLAQRRFMQVLRAIEQGAFERNQRKVGNEEEIYIRHGRAEGGKAIGETWSGHAVHVATSKATSVSPGDYVRARIESAGPHVLYAGEPIA
ncbi:MAG: MiaB/RimO family radical SAM methylthiotransferase [Rubrobacter sp.]|nr:MiaB/RimO family radical SAM methylthiotransferase [Rubrobacter sp.]